MRTEYPEFPEPQSERLLQLIEAFKTRRKSISYQFGGWEMECDAGDTREVLKFRLGDRVRCAHISFDTGGEIMLFAAERGGPRWEYSYCIIADWTGVHP